MNERAASVLEQYELEVIRVTKGRGALICETDSGLTILKEYGGREERISEINPYLCTLRQQGFLVETYRKNKQDAYIVKDRDQRTYILKDYFEGRECHVEELEDLRAAFAFLGKLQGILAEVATPAQSELALSTTSQKNLAPSAAYDGARLYYEVSKKNRELKRILKYLRRKNQKSEFEMYLLAHYEIFYQQALAVEEMTAAGEMGNTSPKTRERVLNARPEKKIKCEQVKNILCHGDFQYHNLLFTSEGIALINFEKMLFDDASRDLAHFFRKVMEKHLWDKDLARQLIQVYCENYAMSEYEYENFVTRLRYPEKFRKIVNYYMNSKKQVQTKRNLEKIQKLIEAEERRQDCIAMLARMKM